MQTMDTDFFTTNRHQFNLEKPLQIKAEKPYASIDDNFTVSESVHNLEDYNILTSMC